MGAAPARQPGPCLAGDRQGGVRVDADKLPTYMPHPKEAVSCEPRRLMAEATSEGGRSYTGHTENAQEGARGIHLFVLIAENPAGSDGNSEFRARKGSFTPGLDKHSQLPDRRAGSLW